MDTKVVRSYATKGIKKLETYIEPGTSHYILRWAGGGELPEELSGVYTNVSLVDQAVFKYISNQKEEKKQSKPKED